MSTIKRIEHYTSQDIFERFEELHNYALDCLEHAKATGTRQKDEEYGAWEKIMLLLGKDIFEIYNDYIEPEQKGELRDWQKRMWRNE